MMGTSNPARDSTRGGVPGGGGAKTPTCCGRDLRRQARCERYELLKPLYLWTEKLQNDGKKNKTKNQNVQKNRETLYSVHEIVSKDPQGNAFIYS